MKLLVAQGLSLADQIRSDLHFAPFSLLLNQYHIHIRKNQIFAIAKHKQKVQPEFIDRSDKIMSNWKSYLRPDAASEAVRAASLEELLRQRRVVRRDDLVFAM